MRLKVKDSALAVHQIFGRSTLFAAVRSTSRFKLESKAQAGPTLVSGARFGVDFSPRILVFVVTQGGWCIGEIVSGCSFVVKFGEADIRDHFLNM